jgi:AcrR family transcriptional regulator
MATQIDVNAQPRVPLSEQRVLGAAVALADDCGVDALSMRKLAQELGVVPMALYKHVSNKDELLDGMVDTADADPEMEAAAEFVGGLLRGSVQPAGITGASAVPLRTVASSSGEANAPQPQQVGRIETTECSPQRREESLLATSAASTGDRTIAAATGRLTSRSHPGPPRSGARSGRARSGGCC